jgi:uncharacterized surface protein with fasciclin (FAS1) repeats
MNTKTTIMKLRYLLVAALGFGIYTSNAQDGSKTIMQNLPASSEHAILAANIKAAGLSNTLSGRGPFTVFAPVDAAFNKGESVSVAKPGKSVDKSGIQDLITYHIVAGKMDSNAIASAVKAGGGKAVLTTLQGGKLTVTMNGDQIVVTDGSGTAIPVIAADKKQSNGVIHVVGTVLDRK